MELPADSRSDEISLQVIACSNCDYKGLAVYQESRRGDLRSEAWEHTGYRVENKSVIMVDRLIRKCPQPGNSACSCRSHLVFRIYDQVGVWQGLKQINFIGSFQMELV